MDAAPGGVMISAQRAPDSGCDFDDMAWTHPTNSKAAVDRAGERITAPITDENALDYFGALDVVNNWRASHSFPLNTFTVTLKRKGKQVDPDCLVAQRIKRL